MIVVQDDRHLTSCAAYALGVLDAGEVREFEKHLQSGCVKCVSQLAAFRDVVAALSLAVPQMMPSPEVKDRVLFSARLAEVAKVQLQTTSSDADATNPEPVVIPTVSVPDRKEDVVESPSTPKRRFSWLALGLTVVALALVVGASAYIVSLLNTIGRQRDYIAMYQTQVGKLVEELEWKDSILNVLASRHLLIVPIVGLQIYPEGHGKILWDADGKTIILQVANLPPTPIAKSYQLWMIRDQSPFSVGVFEVRNAHDGYFRFQPAGIDRAVGVTDFFVTLESKGGSMQPTGDTYLFGKVEAAR